ncbi:hypothetical protein [Lacticaseibacillus daqingensis]|uniref:hypothetical protein n=1 Tax=Lacticaseibacillus daqingensis TaxID=2486014 RepID=UPI000F79D70F|nr:hypothetical protein [Lacticaseibacillus daqingensis]
MFGSSTPGESKGMKVFRLIVAAVCVIVFLVWSLNRHHYTGTIVAVTRVSSGRFHSSHENRVTVQIGTRKIVFEDTANLLIGKLNCLNPHADPKTTYKITTSGLPGHLGFLRENIVKLTKVN